MGTNTHQIKLLQAINIKLEKTNVILGGLLITSYNKGVLKEEEVIRYLRISTAAFRKVTQGGKLPHIILDGEKRYLWSDIQNYLNDLKPEKQVTKVGFKMNPDKQ